MCTSQSDCRQLPLDVLGVVAATFIKSPFELHLFAAVSRTWLRAVATSEDIHAQRLATIAINDAFVDPTRDVDMWMLDPLKLTWNGDLYTAQTAATVMFDVNKFLVREMLVERAAMCGLEYLRLHMLTPKLHRELIEQIPDDGVHALSVLTTNATDVDVVALVKGRSALTSLYVPGVTASLRRSLQGSFETLCSLSISDRNVVTCALDQLPRLERLTVNEVQPVLPEVRAEAITSIGKLHRLLELRLRLTTWDDSWRSWPSKLGCLTSLETLEMQTGVYEDDLVFDGAGFGESLTFLNFSWICSVTTATAVSAAGMFPRLKVLHATMCEENTIGDAGYAAIGSKLKELKQLELWMNELSLSQLQSLSGLQHLELLSITGAKLDDTATADELVKVWSSMPSLTALGLEDLSWLVTPEAYSGLLDSLVACPKLKMLNIDGLAQSIHSDDVKSDALGNLTELESVSLSNSRLPPQTAGKLSGLTKLKIIEARNSLGLGSAVDISQLIRNNCAQLSVVNLPDCNGFEAEHIILLGKLCPRLVTLDISRLKGGHLGYPNPWVKFAEGVKALGDVPFFPSLMKLTMGSGNSLDNDVAIILHRAHALEILDLSGSTALTKNLVPVLAASRVGHFNLEACRGLGDPVEVLKVMLKGNPRLHTFEMRSVERVGSAIEDAVSRAAEHHPSLLRVVMDDGTSNYWNRTPAPQVV